MSLTDNCSQTPAMVESQLKQGVEEKHSDRRYVAHRKAGNGHTLQSSQGIRQQKTFDQTSNLGRNRASKPRQEIQGLTCSL